jgi:hypothetical protein
MEPHGDTTVWLRDDSFLTHFIWSDMVWSMGGSAEVSREVDKLGERSPAYLTFSFSSASCIISVSALYN